MLLIAQISMMAMVAIVTVTVVLRYCFNTGLSWAEEVPRLLVTLFAFIACAIGVRDHLHVAVNAVYNQLPVGGKARKAARRVLTTGRGEVLLCGLFMLYTGGARTMKLLRPCRGAPPHHRYLHRVAVSADPGLRAFW
ncbi:MAG: TRAP transporter small permease [Christensenellales bacterium]